MKSKKQSNSRRDLDVDLENSNGSINELTYGRQQYQLSPIKSRDSLDDD